MNDLGFYCGGMFLLSVFFGVYLVIINTKRFEKGKIYIINKYIGVTGVEKGWDLNHKMREILSISPYNDDPPLDLIEEFTDVYTNNQKQARYLVVLSWSAEIQGFYSKYGEPKIYLPEFGAFRICVDVSLFDQKTKKQLNGNIFYGPLPPDKSMFYYEANYKGLNQIYRTGGLPEKAAIVEWIRRKLINRFIEVKT
jgi:hypothetical protein